MAYHTSGTYWSSFLRQTYGRRTLLRGAALAGVGLAGAATLACNTRTQGSPKPSSQTQAPKGGSISSLVGSTGTPVGANEQPVRGGAMSRPLRFKTAWDVNEANNRAVMPDLATSVESPDAVTWTLKLRPDAKFHNLAPVNSYAVEADAYGIMSGTIANVWLASG